MLPTCLEPLDSVSHQKSQVVGKMSFFCFLFFFCLGVACNPVSDKVLVSIRNPVCTFAMHTPNNILAFWACSKIIHSALLTAYRFFTHPYFQVFFLFDLSHNYLQWLKNHVVKFRHNTNLALNIISFLFSQPFLFIKNLNPLWRCSKITQRCYITNSTDTFQSIKLAIKTNHPECCILHLLHRHMRIHTHTDLHARKYTMPKEAMKLRQW